MARPFSSIEAKRLIDEHKELKAKLSEGSTAFLLLKKHLMTTLPKKF